VDILLEGLEVYGHHGVSPEEKVLGQRLLYDVRLTIDECQAAYTDRVEDTVDYTEVLDLIEVWVQVTKPHPPVAWGLDSVAAAVEMQRSDIEG
jgi:dihydroneopterin aldolase